MVKKTQFANLIGMYTSSDAIDALIARLNDLGYCPYMIKDHEDRFRLFVGAFFSRAGAMRQYRELQSDSVQSEVVKR